MSKPHNKLKRPDHPGQIKTMFSMEGNPSVYVVIQERDRMSREDMWFPDLSHAFSWCRKHRCNFVYNPAVPTN